MKRNVDNERIERNFYETAINQRHKRTLRVSKACLAATVAGTFLGSYTKATPAVATVVPAAIVAVGERKRSTRVTDGLISDFRDALETDNSPYVLEKAIIKDGDIRSINYLDMRSMSKDSRYTLLEQSGGTLAGIFGGAVASGRTPDAAEAATLGLVGIASVVAVFGGVLDSYILRGEYSSKLDNVEGVKTLE